MTVKDYIASDAVQISLNSVLNQMMSDYGWSNTIDLQNFYNRYVDLIIAGQLKELVFNQTSGYYSDIISQYTAESGLTSASNFITNFEDLAINKFDVPQNLMSPVTFFNTTVQPVQNAQDTATGSILGDALSMTGKQITSGVGSVFSGIGDLIGKAISGIFSNPIILIVVVGIVLLIVFKDKIFKAL